MSERNDADQGNLPTTNEKVGDLLHKERVSRRITVETIAKDLKLNVRYIKALESSEYQSLPADPYVRVYLRSLAKYLSLNPEEILKKFYEERGVQLTPAATETNSKIVISVQEKEGGNPMLLIAVAVILLLGGLMFIANRQGWLSDSQTVTPVVAPVDSLDAENTIAEDTLPEAVMIASNVVSDDSAIAVLNADTTKPVDTAAAAPINAMSFNLQVIKDSVWVQVFSDGDSYKNILRRGQAKSFSAKDSFNIHVGNNEVIKYTLDSKAVKVGGTGVVAFKLDRQGIKTWPLTKWNTVFKDRL
jgi:cytoskeletal protein RodZ